MDGGPDIRTERGDGSVALALSGDWALSAGAALEKAANDLPAAAAGAAAVRLDVSAVRRLDTAGAWLISRARHTMEAAGAQVRMEGADASQQTLLREAGWRNFEVSRPRGQGPVLDRLEDLGRGVVFAGSDFVRGVAFFGEALVAMGRAFLRPRDFRLTSIVYHLDNFGLRSTPIIILINFLVGCIVAQQGIFQLRKFGAETFAVDLIGILILRELGVLLTSIMIAGRSGSAITAEIGSMKMREEIDALKVMGLSPAQVLVVPRLLALLAALPLLTFIANMAAIAGGMCVSWVYGGVSPEAFMSRLQNAIGMNTFMVGMIKAPFMALVIGVIAAMEGAAVQGSAESLGRRVTASVVKSIFMVIVVDGLFAMFFAAIRY